MDRATGLSVPARPHPSFSCSRPGAFALATLIGVSCGSPIVARMPIDGIRFALPFLVGVSIQAMAAYRCRSPADLWKAHSLVIASLGVIMTLFLTSLSLWRVDAAASLYVTYGATLVAAGIRPVIAAFFQERTRARIDSQDTVFAAGGVWAMISGVVTLLMIRANAPAMGALVGAHRLSVGVGAATLALGAALTLQSLIRSRLRRRWFRRVAEGKIDGYRLGVWDKAIDATPPRLLEDPDQEDEGAGLVLFRGSESAYRSQAHEALGIVSGLAASSRPMRWVLAVVAGTVAPLLLTSWLFMCSFAHGDSLKGL